MITRKQHTLTIPTSAVRNTGGRSGPQGLKEPTSDEVLRELRNKNYQQLLPLIAEKIQKEKEQQDKLNTVGGKEQSASVHSYSRHQSSHAKGTKVQPRKHHHKGTSPRGTSRYSESEGSEGGHWKSKSKRHRSNTYEDDLSQPWTCEERNPFTPRIRHFDFPRTRMPSHVKTYDGSGDPKDHLKLFQYASKTERWAMPTWCHMFNSTLTGNARVWFNKLPKEFIDSYEDLRAAFGENYLQQTKHIKDPVEIHHIKQRDGESTEDFMKRYKTEVLDMEGAPKCMKISEFMHGITHPELIKRLYERIPRSIDEMYRVTTSDQKPDRFSLLTKTLEEIFALEKGKSKAPPPMNDNPKPQKKGETAGKDKPLAILMIQPWERVAKQRVTQSFSLEIVISLPSLGEEDGTEGPMIIEAEIGGYFVHQIYVDGGASSEVLYEHCFVRLRPEIRSQMILATTSLIGFSGETIWPLGQISLLVKIGAEEHSTSAWMNFMVIMSPSQHNGIIGKTGIRKICSVPSTTYRMLKFPVEGGIVTLRSSRVIPMECAMIFGPSTQQPVTSQVLEEKIKVAIHPEYPEQTIAIGSTQTEKGRKELCALLRQNLDTKEKGQAPEGNKAIQKEVEKLVDAGIMKEEAEVAFRQMKKLIAELPMLTAPKEREELIMYLAAAKEVISAVLMTEREGKQMPVYFVSRALRGPKINYTPHGKTGVSLAQHKQGAKKILPGTHNCCNHRSADKATAVKLRNHRKDAKVEI
ncbi:reverse transcriptase domain-containing protein [Tanacetum coccineum]